MKSYPVCELPDQAYRPVDLALNASDERGMALSELPARPVDEFASPLLEPLCYPGSRPEHSFMLAEGQVYPVTAAETEEGVRFGVKTEQGVWNLDDILRHHGVSLMEERFPVVGFGSNACPGQTAERFSAANNKWGDITNPGDHHIMPTLRGSLKDVAAAYSSKIGVRGYVFAELIEEKGAETEVFVSFLSAGQLARLNRAENAYELCEVGEVAIDGLSQPIKAFCYVGKNSVLLSPQGTPILVEGVHATGTDLPAMPQEDLLSMLADEFGSELDELYPHSPFFANTARSLMAYLSYRQEFLRRNDTDTMQYKHHPGKNEEPDEQIGVALQNILHAAGRVSADRLLNHIPEEARSVTPQPFSSLYNMAYAHTV